MQYITGHWVAAAVYAAVRLGLADRMQAGPRTADELAQAVGAHGPSVYRLLRALAALGIVREGPPRQFALTELGDLLRADHPRSMRSMALFQGAAPHWLGWGNFVHSVRTGESAFAQVHGQGFFDYCQTDAEFAAAFNGAMTAMSATAAEAVLEAYDFTGIRRLVDVGGGHGYLLSRILQRYPEMNGLVFDLPQVVAGAPPVLAAAGVADRCQTIAGSFFDFVPPADAYIAKNIIHDWSDERSLQILSHVRRAIEGRGRVLLVELVVSPDASDGAMPILIDLEMLHATHGGRERTAEEFAALLAAAGLRLDRVVKTRSMFNVLEAVPAD
jgi:hypothetical protein